MRSQVCFSGHLFHGMGYSHRSHCVCWPFSRWTPAPTCHLEKPPPTPAPSSVKHLEQTLPHGERWAVPTRIVVVMLQNRKAPGRGGCLQNSDASLYTPADGHASQSESAGVGNAAELSYLHPLYSAGRGRSSPGVERSPPGATASGCPQTVPPALRGFTVGRSRLSPLLPL